MSDNAIHWINRSPVNSMVDFVNSYPLDSNYPSDSVIRPLYNWALFLVVTS